MSDGFDAFAIQNISMSTVGVAKADVRFDFKKQVNGRETTNNLVITVRFEGDTSQDFSSLEESALRGAEEFLSRALAAIEGNTASSLRALMTERDAAHEAERRRSWERVSHEAAS